MSYCLRSTLCVSNLPGDIRAREVEDLFYKYGPIAHFELKISSRPPGYAFVQFEDACDGQDAINGRDGYYFDGHCLRVELAHGGCGLSSSSDLYDSYGGGHSGGAPKHTEYRMLATGLSSCASLQVFCDGGGTTGIVDYTNHDDMKHDIRKLDDLEFQNAFTKSYVQVREYKGNRRPSMGRSISCIQSRCRGCSYIRSRRRSKSPKQKSSCRSPARSHSRSIFWHPPSRSESRSLSRSPSRSRSAVPSVRKKHESRSQYKSSSMSSWTEFFSLPSFPLLLLPLLLLFPFSCALPASSITTAVDILSDGGMSSFAVLLQHAEASLNLSSLPSATLLSVPDKIISHSLPSLSLFSFHILPSYYSTEDLFSLQFFTQLPTLLPLHFITVTSFSTIVSFNGVTIDDLPVYDDGSVVIYRISRLLNPSYNLSSYIPEPEAAFDLGSLPELEPEPEGEPEPDFVLEPHEPNSVLEPMFGSPSSLPVHHRRSRFSVVFFVLVLIFVSFSSVYFLGHLLFR